MANNFVGKVTRQEKKSGVTLRARVTGPKQKVSKYQDVKCMIKEAGLTDNQAVIAALNVVVSNLEQKNIKTLTNSITSEMPRVVVEYDVQIDYRITGDITSYVNDTGKVFKRPAYGENIVLGNLEVIASKNSATASQTVTIGVSPYIIDDLQAYVVEQLAWANIKGQNSDEDVDRNKSGKTNVYKNLNLITSLPQNDMTSDPITIAWEITDDYVTTTSAASPRITTAGVVERGNYTSYNTNRNNPSYVSISGFSNLFEIVNNRDNSIPGNGIGNGFLMRVGGIKLKAKASYNNVSIQNVDFTDIAILSNMLTNSEVAAYLTTVFSEKKSSWFVASDASTDDTVKFTPAIGTATIGAMGVSGTLRYGPSNESIFKILTNSSQIETNTQENSLTGQYGILTALDNNNTSISLYNLTGVSDTSKTIQDLESENLGINPQIFNPSLWTKDSSGNYSLLDFVQNSGTPVTDLLVKVPYTIQHYGGSSQTVFVTCFRFTLEAAPT